ncbi:hypothetical protein HHK36_033365 [Tetracentron sinense]|uniref:Ycf54 n=1 Tax=Tetracentron sinense TaxID=13715 RepID=A0A834Y671_TETSI|nr:hypothetical protein HHK36_033365 [Tetracentron sinense]
MFAPATLTLRSYAGLQSPAEKVFQLPSRSRSRSRSINGSHSRQPSLEFKRLSVKTAVAAVDSNQLSSSQKEQSNKYYFLVANAKFMLDEEEHFKELLFERLRLYGERDKEQDFWLVIEPKFLDNFPNITKRLKRPAVALVSTNANILSYLCFNVGLAGLAWLGRFMKLRLDRVLSESYESDNLEQALASNPTNIEFEKPQNWVAPYPKYEFGWWESFLPPGSAEPKV